MRLISNSWKYATIGMLLSSLTACATSTPKPVDTTNLGSLQNLTLQNRSVTGQTVSTIRRQALQDTAMTLGAQGGLAWRAKQLNALLGSNQAMLMQVFNFQGVMLPNNVLPPVLEEADQSLHLAGDDAIRLSGKTYKIISQARFVTTPPTWRDYLMMNYPPPDVPDNTLLPRNSQERAIWIQYINLGWQQGIMQANNIYADNLARLQRDFKGMMLYRSLLAQNIVSAPFVARTNLGITSNNNNSEMYINDQVLRITALPQLNPNSSEWRPAVSQ